MTKRTRFSPLSHEDEIYFSNGLILAVVRRGMENIVPCGKTVLHDKVILYTKKDIRDSVEINL